MFPPLWVARARLGPAWGPRGASLAVTLGRLGPACPREHQTNVAARDWSDEVIRDMCYCCMKPREWRAMTDDHN